MPVEVLMPALSPTMKEGNLVKWMKKEGDSVTSGDVIAEIETDKATMEVEAVDEGKLAKIIVPEGTDNVKVNELIALILEEDEDESALEGFEIRTSKAVGSPKKVENEMVDPIPAVASGSGSPQAAPSSSQPSSSGERIFASPVAKRIAEQNNVDLSQIQGTGPKNRVIKADVEKVISGGGAKPAVTSLHAAQSGPSYQDIPLNNMRKVIAQRLTESKQQVPHFYLSVDCELDTLMDVRKAMNKSLTDEGIKISVNDFIIKACAAALQKVPEANASWEGDFIRQYKSSDVSVAVAIEGGLITPIVKAAHLKSLSQISIEMKDLAARARDGKLKPEEFQGGSFSISNLGMYGIKNFSAVINPPQGAILAVGAGEQRVIAKNGDMKVATVMSCTLSVDHRAIDGAVGANLLNAIKKYIENPMLLLA